MIWVLGITLSLAVSLYLAAPFLAAETSPQTSAEIEAYRAELRALDLSDNPDAAQSAKLKAQLLKAAKTKAPKTGTRSLGIAGAIGLCLVGASAGLYSQLGSPNFIAETRQDPPALTQEPSQDFAALIPRFEARLAENPEDATGWTLYGRTLMLAGDTEAGLRAYEKAIELSDTPELRKEYEAALKFAEQIKSGPDADTIQELQSLPSDEQAAAIEGMVESLRARLETEPENAEGWLRLLRSRKVLGQEDAAKADMKILRQVLPDQADAIISQSGWEE